MMNLRVIFNKTESNITKSGFDKENTCKKRFILYLFGRLIGKLKPFEQLHHFQLDLR